MTFLVPLVMFGWIPVVLLLCALLSTRRAVVVSFIIAWSFLPMVLYRIQGLPEYSKMSATCGGVLLGALFFDINKLFSFRPSMLDIPMTVWCLCPCVSSLVNGLGLYDGVSMAFAQTVMWGFPYFIGRLYLGDFVGVRELAAGILMGGLIYVPLCLFEVRMSPQLHRIFYGIHAFEDFAQAMRFGGWRPTVFMAHGLMVGMWMSMAAMVALWMWWTKATQAIMGIPMWLAAPALLITAVLCKSTGALLLMAGGLLALATVKLFNTRAILTIMVLIAPLYMALRVTKAWDGSELREFAKMVGNERSQSVEFRLFNENLLIDKAMQQPIFGWGGWGRNQIIDKNTGFRTVVDGAWIDAMGKFGLVGLLSFTAALLMPPLLALRKYPVHAWASPAFAAVAALLVVDVLYMLDNLPNAMINPIYVLAAGGLTGVLARKVPVVATTPVGPPQRNRVTRVPAPRMNSGAVRL